MVPAPAVEPRPAEPPRAPGPDRLRVGRALALLGLAASALGVVLAASRGAEGFATPVDDPRPLPSPSRFAEVLDVHVFQRGNLHAHSAITDGDTPAQVVFAWYRARGYQFLALTDHNRHLDPARYPEAAGPDFVLLPGEEITMVAGGQPVHVNALCTKRQVGRGPGFVDVRRALDWATREVRAQGGVALVNHPNFHYALGVEDVASAESAGAQLLEIWSGHPHVAAAGDASHASVESRWDELLGRGSRLAAVAVDDAHAFKGRGKHVPDARPGTGWVEVFAEETRLEAICSALGAGKFYASSGPRLRRFAVEGGSMSLWVDDPILRAEFVGEGGRVLAASPFEPEGELFRATYRLRGGEPYVRARVLSPGGGRAWTQAYRVVR